MARVPIVALGDTLIVSVLEDLGDKDALALQEEVLAAVERRGAGGVLLDISVVEFIDSFLGRLLNDIALGGRLLGASTILVGMQPAVAITLVELGLELKQIRTAPNVEKGLALLRRRAPSRGH